MVNQMKLKDARDIVKWDAMVMEGMGEEWELRRGYASMGRVGAKVSRGNLEIFLIHRNYCDYVDWYDYGLGRLDNAKASIAQFVAASNVVFDPDELNFMYDVVYLIYPLVSTEQRTP